MTFISLSLTHCHRKNGKMSVKYRLTLQLFFTAFRCMSVSVCVPFFHVCIEVDDDDDEVYLVEEGDHKMKHLKQII